MKTIDADPNDTATTGTQSPLVIQQLRSAGVTSVIPLMPFNVFFPVLQAETAQQYFPRLLLSDYESSILSSLGLIPIPYAKALDGQEGVTTETLGGIDDDRPQSQGGYDTAVRRCWTVWHKVYPQVPPGNMNDFIEEQGPIVGWCQAIHLFETAAKAAGPDLNRRTFVSGHVQDQQLPRDLVPRSQLRPEQALRTNRVPGGQAAHQLATILAVQTGRGPAAAGYLLGQRPALGAAAGRLTRRPPERGMWPSYGELRTSNCREGLRPRRTPDRGTPKAATDAVLRSEVLEYRKPWLLYERLRRLSWIRLAPGGQFMLMGSSSANVGRVP